MSPGNAFRVRHGRRGVGRGAGERAGEGVEQYGHALNARTRVHSERVNGRESRRVNLERNSPLVGVSERRARGINFTGLSPYRGGPVDAVVVP